MALPTFTYKSAKGGSGFIQIAPLTGASHNTIGTYVGADNGGTIVGCYNVKDSALTGTVQKQDLKVNANIEIVESAFNAEVAALTFKGEVSSSDYVFENSQTITDITLPDNALYVLCHHYLPGTLETAGKTRVTSFVGVLSGASGDVTTAEGERNLTTIEITGIEADGAVSIPASGAGVWNSELVTVATATIAAGSFGTVTWATSA